MTPTPAVLQLLLEQFDEKHTAAHQRLRVDLTEGLETVNRTMGHLSTLQQNDHVEIVLNRDLRERRQGLSNTHAVIIAACVGGGFRLVEVFVNSILALMKR